MDGPGEMAVKQKDATPVTKQTTGESARKFQKAIKTRSISVESPAMRDLQMRPINDVVKVSKGAGSRLASMERE